MRDDKVRNETLFPNLFHLSYFFAVLLVHVVTLLSDGLKIEGEVHQNKCEGDILPVDGVLPPGETRDDVRNERKRRLFVSSYLKGRFLRPGRSREETRARRRRPETIDKMRDENKEEKRHRGERRADRYSKGGGDAWAFFVELCVGAWRRTFSSTLAGRSAKAKR